MDTPSKIARRIFREKSKENRLQSDNINQIKETCPVIPVNIWRSSNLSKKQTVDRGAEFESGSFGCIQWEIIIGNSIHIEIIDCDDELGLYSRLGVDGINLLDWLAERGTFYPLSLHTVNPFGYRDMQKMIERYWK